MDNRLMITIVDYGMGNLRSAQKGFECAGLDAQISDDPRAIERAEAIVLPGVGAFKDCYDGLRSRRMVEPLQHAAASGKPFLGICVGLQLLFDESEEGEGSEGLHILPGKVVRFPRHMPAGLKVPHMGWNRLQATEPRCDLLEGTSAEPYVYFVHSYYARPAVPDHVLATTEHGIKFAAIVGRDNVVAVQFHPEKSQREGIAILRAFGNRMKAFA
jgi:glutamine amidotransferase